MNQPKYVSLVAKKLDGLKFRYQIGYTMFTKQWGVFNNETQDWFTVGENLPYTNTKAICETIASGGLLDGSKFVKSLSA